MTVTERALLAQSIVAGVARRPVELAVEGSTVILRFTTGDQDTAEELGAAARDQLAAAFPSFDRAIVPGAGADGFCLVQFTVHLDGGEVTAETITDDQIRELRGKLAMEDPDDDAWPVYIDWALMSPVGSEKRERGRSECAAAYNARRGRLPS